MSEASWMYKHQHGSGANGLGVNVDRSLPRADTKCIEQNHNRSSRTLGRAVFALMFCLWWARSSRSWPVFPCSRCVKLHSPSGWKPQRVEAPCCSLRAMGRDGRWWQTGKVKPAAAAVNAAVWIALGSMNRHGYFSCWIWNFNDRD